MIKVAAHKEGKTLHEKLRELGTDGIQGPTFYNYETGELLGTTRLHDTTVTQEQMVAEGRTKGANMVNKKVRTSTRRPVVSTFRNTHGVSSLTTGRG